MSTMQAPPVAPIGWKEVDLGEGTALYSRRYNGLAGIVSVEHFATDELDPYGGPGTYVHMSISHSARYPGWDEMRDWVYSCGFFDATRDVVMVLPPPAEYVNIHNNCFHWWQKR